MSNERTNKKNIIYAIIGVLTLVVAIVGATFAYYTATQSNNVMIGNMASISFGLDVVKKTDADNTRGLIPMTNSMVEKAVTNASTKGICLDDNSNAVCQIYKITVVNKGSASMFVDGYVTLEGGSGKATDVSSATTTMRWAQVFCNETGNNLTSCTTAGASTARQNETTGFSWGALGSVTNSGHDVAEIKETFTGTDGVTANGTIQNNPYPLIKTNYIRISKHTGTKYVQTNDVSSALVYNQYLEPNDNNDANNTGTSSSTYKDAQVYYFVLWLSETGTNQTVGSSEPDVATANDNFFSGNVTFISAQGSEITSRFSGWTAVTPDTK